MPDFWKHSGYRLLDRRDDGLLGVTDDFLRAYFLRPEVRLEPESCSAERSLHRSLLDNPRRPIEPGEISAIADPDTRENYSLLIDFRDRLVEAGTIERCYLTLFRAPSGLTPPLFIDQLTHVILRRILEVCTDPLRVRAAELFFRSQKVSIQAGGILLADELTVEANRETAGLGNLGRMLVEMNAPVDQARLDVLSTDNADSYWARSDDYDFVLNASFGQPGLRALSHVLEAWLFHLLGLETSIEPVDRVDDDRWVWHVGLDAESNSILNDLYQGTHVDDDRRRRLLALFHVTIKDQAAVRPEIAGRPVYFGLGMNEQKIVRMKPQNPLTNMPLVSAY